IGGAEVAQEGGGGASTGRGGRASQAIGSAFPAAVTAPSGSPAHAAAPDHGATRAVGTARAAGRRERGLRAARIGAAGGYGWRQASRILSIRPAGRSAGRPAKRLAGRARVLRH